MEVLRRTVATPPFLNLSWPGGFLAPLSSLWNNKMKFTVNQRVRHLRTGTLYTIIGTPDQVCYEPLRQRCYAYIPVADTFKYRIWVRPETEVEDGRFELVEEK